MVVVRVWCRVVALVLFRVLQVLVRCARVQVMQVVMELFTLESITTAIRELGERARVILGLRLRRFVMLRLIVLAVLVLFVRVVLRRPVILLMKLFITLRTQLPRSTAFFSPCAHGS